MHGLRKSITIRKFAEVESDIFEDSMMFEKKIEAFEDLEFLWKRLFKFTDQIKDEERLAVAANFLRLFHQCYCNLRMAYMMVLRGHYHESLSLLRPAIEITVHLFIMSKNPAINSGIWSNRDNRNFKSQYRKIYGTKIFFPDDLPNREILRRLYGDCCEYSAHSTPGMFGNKFRLKRRRNNYSIGFFHLQTHEKLSEFHLNLILFACAKILDVLPKAFERILGKDEASNVDFMCQVIQSHMNDAAMEKIKYLTKKEAMMQNPLYEFIPNVFL